MRKSHFPKKKFGSKHRRRYKMKGRFNGKSDRNGGRTVLPAVFSSIGRLFHREEWEKYHGCY